MQEEITRGTHDVEAAAEAAMCGIFGAVGFDIVDDASYDILAEYAEMHGEHSSLYRSSATVHGRCWKIGEGLEVWSVLYETKGETYYADCRPAFRSRYVRTLRPWELIEYDEDGEAVMRGSISGNDVVFELQNLTAVNSQAFRETQISVAIAGLAYSAQVHSSTRSCPHRFIPVEQLAHSGEDACENDYFVCGRVLSWREIRNCFTGGTLYWIYLDTGQCCIEIIVNRRALRGRPKFGSTLSATIWLQGHILGRSDISARYEGVDRQCPTSDFWISLLRGN